MVAPNFQAKGTVVNGASAASVAPGYPAVIANDIIIAEIYLESTATVTPPAGFTLFETVTNPDVGFRVNRFWKRATGSESGTGSFTWTGSTWRDGYMWSVRGAITTGTPFEILGQVHQNDLVSSNTPSYSGATDANDMLVCLSVHDYWGAYFTPASGWTRSAFEGSATSIYTDTFATPSSFGPVVMAADAASTDELNRAKSVSALAFIPADSTPAVEREAISASVVSSGAWAGGNLSCTPAYPTGNQENDVLFLFVHNKTSAVTTEFGSQVQVPTTPSGWTRVGTFWNTTDTNSLGAGIGRTRITVFVRTVPAGGLSGTLTVAQAASGTTTGWSIQAAMLALRPEAGRTNVQYSAILGGWGGSNTASTSWASTLTGFDLDLLDVVTGIVGVTDNSAVNSLTLTQTGTTFGTATATPGSTVYASQNRQASAAWTWIPSAISPGTGSISFTASIAASEKGIVGLLQTRFTAEVLPLLEPGRMLLAASM